jgi:hypothetical protein
MRERTEGILLKDDIRKAGHQLLDHQCWVMGKDVLSSEGNLLCEFGFRQVRCPNGGMTQYELENALAEGEHVYLWGFGVFFGNDNEGIFLGRKDFKPSRTLGHIELHSKEDPHFGDETSRLNLFLQGLSWFADYEQWVSRRMPDAYRELCLAAFPRRALPRNEFTRCWKDLIRCIEEDQRPGWLDGQRSSSGYCITLTQPSRESR